MYIYIYIQREIYTEMMEAKKSWCCLRAGRGCESYSGAALHRLRGYAGHHIYIYIYIYAGQNVTHTHTRNHKNGFPQHKYYTSKSPSESTTENPSEMSSTNPKEKRQSFAPYIYIYILCIIYIYICIYMCVYGIIIYNNNNNNNRKK